MALIDQSQRIELVFDGKTHWFNVWRYTTPQELLTALLQANIEVPNQRIVSYTACYEAGEECGAMYLLDSSVATYAREATHMALGILAREGLATIVPTTGPAPEDQEDLAALVATITSQLYSRRKYY